MPRARLGLLVPLNTRTPDPAIPHSLRRPPPTTPRRALVTRRIGPAAAVAALAADGHAYRRPLSRRITRAGTPTATPRAGTSFVTTEPAPVTAPAPIRTGATSIESLPM